MTHHQSDKKHITRTLEIINCIQRGSGMNAEELAERFEVSKRTVYRDLNTIRHSGVHVRFDNLADGYRILPDEGSLTIQRQISLEQLRELVLGIYCAAWYQIEGTRPLIEESLELFVDKLDDTERIAIRRLQRACKFFSSKSPVCTLQRDIIKAIADSIMRQQQVELLVIEDEAARQKDAEPADWENSAAWIRFAPHAIFFENGVWYVSGQNQFRKSLCCFNVANIFNVRFTNFDFTISRNDPSLAVQDRSVVFHEHSIPPHINPWKQNKTTDSIV